MPDICNSIDACNYGEEGLCSFLLDCNGVCCADNNPDALCGTGEFECISSGDPSIPPDFDFSIIEDSFVCSQYIGSWVQLGTDICSVCGGSGVAEACECDDTSGLN